MSISQNKDFYRYNKTVQTSSTVQSNSRICMSDIIYAKRLGYLGMKIVFLTFFQPSYLYLDVVSH